jgi:hypothetical protein
MTALMFLAIVVTVSAGLAAIMTGAWLAWRSTRNSGWIDTTWTFGLGAVGCAGAFTPSLVTGGVTTRQLLVAVLVAVWSLRLGLHIARRTLRITDDPRYGKMIAEWGADASRQIFFLAQKQALVSIPLALSMVLAAWNPWPGLRLQDALGVAVLIAAIAGEGLSDAQLRRFRADPANRNRIAMSAYGAGRGIRIISSNGWAGSLIRCWPSISAAPTCGAGPRSSGRPACIGCWCTSPAFRRWRRTCWSAGATNSAPTRRAPMRSSRRRRGQFEGG